MSLHILFLSLNKWSTWASLTKWLHSSYLSYLPTNLNKCSYNYILFLLSTTYSLYSFHCYTLKPTTTLYPSTHTHPILSITMKFTVFPSLMNFTSSFSTTTQHSYYSSILLFSISKHYPNSYLLRFFHLNSTQSSSECNYRWGYCLPFSIWS